MMGRWGASLIGLPLGGFNRCRKEVIHEAPTLDVAFLVIVDLFVQSGSEPHRQPSVDLTFDDHGVDNIAAIINSDKASDLHLSSPLIDIHHADITPKGIGQVWRVVVRHRFEARLHSRGMVGIRGKGDLLNRLRLERGTTYEESSWLPLKILFVCFQE